MSASPAKGFKHSQTLTFGLLLMMRDESANLRRCIGSLRDHIDMWCVVDTGSADNSIEIVRELLKDIPGELYERPWVDFDHNRTEALNLAKGLGISYAAFPDCDDSMFVEGKLPLDLWEKAKADAVQVKVSHGSLVHYRPHVFRLASDWEFRGKLHEFATLTKGRGTGRQIQTQQITFIARTEGVRSKDPRKYQNDAARLQRELDEGKDDDLRTRNQFYLAQSHLHYGNKPDAKINYQKRLDMTGGYEEERFICCQELVSLCDDDPELQTQYALKSLELHPKRLEAVYFYLKKRRERGETGDVRSYAIASLANLFVENREPPNGGLFVLPYIYNFAFDVEFSHAARMCGQHEDAVSAVRRASTHAENDPKTSADKNSLKKLLEDLETELQIADLSAAL